MDWLAIASHEVGHIKHIIQSNKLADQIYLTLLKARENSNGSAIVPSKDEYRLQYYVGMFADSYIKAGSHDGSTIEHEAERKAFGKSAKENVKRYSPQNIMPQWEMLFHKLTEK